jgi:uncharacterized protein YecE (DUF72 family)
MGAEYFLGCSGFYYNHWRGKFYPQNLPKTKWLNYYTDFFNSLELNNTFYRFPSQKLLEGWYQKTPPNFTFAVKANRIITHLHKFNNTETYTDNFYKLAHMLHEKLLCVLFQLPPQVHKNMALLETIAGQLDTSVMNVLEFRHESWWDSEVYDFLRRKGIVFCSVSASELPEDLINTCPAIYLRFHGKDSWYKQDYPDEQLVEWANRIKKQATQRVLCYFNNDYNTNAPRNCLTLKRILSPSTIVPSLPLWS